MCGMFVMLSCSNNANGNDDDKQGYTGVPLIILDNDIGSSTDYLFAMQMAYMYHRQGRCRLLGIEGDEEFILSERGVVTLSPEAATDFTPSAMGHCRYQKPGSKEWVEKMLNKIRTANRWKIEQ